MAMAKQKKSTLSWRFVTILRFDKLVANLNEFVQPHFCSHPIDSY